MNSRPVVIILLVICVLLSTIFWLRDHRSQQHASASVTTAADPTLTEPPAPTASSVDVSGPRDAVAVQEEATDYGKRYDENCYDSDGGVRNQYFLPGEARGRTSAGMLSAVTDTCASDTVLLEAWCREDIDNRGAYSLEVWEHTCPEGCTDGACNKPAGTLPLGPDIR